MFIISFQSFYIVMYALSFELILLVVNGLEKSVVEKKEKSVVERIKV